MKYILQHKGTVKIETERLVLRKFTIYDAKDIFNNWASDVDICKYLRWTKHKNINETINLLNNWIYEYENKSFYQWAITIKESGFLIGSIGLFIINEHDLCGDIGYCISKECWKQGFATEAVKSILKFAFNEVEFNRIETYHSINNPASGKVMIKSGMTFEGVAEEKYKSNLGFEDCNMYSIVKKNLK